MIELALVIMIKGHVVGVLPIKERFATTEDCEKHAAEVIKHLKPKQHVQWQCERGFTPHV